MAIHIPTIILIFAAYVVYNFVPMNLFFGFMLGSIATAITMIVLGIAGICKSLDRFTPSQLLVFFTSFVSGYKNRRGMRNTVPPEVRPFRYCPPQQEECVNDEQPEQEQPVDEQPVDEQQEQMEVREVFTTFRALHNVDNDETHVDETYN